MPGLPILGLLLLAPPSDLAARLQRLASGFDGRVGIAVIHDGKRTSVNGDRRFSLQSVMKLVVATAVMERVDEGGLRLNQPVLVRRSDLSVHVQPIAKRVGPKGYRTTVGDLVRRAIIDSDSAATDVLYAKVGGSAGIMGTLRRKDLSGIRVDRDERHLQSDTAGLTWRPEYTDPAEFAAAEARVPPGLRTAAFERYRKDSRDTATPDGMAELLRRLATGTLLSSSSTHFLRRAMSDCATGRDRLRAGTVRGWKLEHKTGSSGTVDGLTVATNDVGILIAPDGRPSVVVVFVADSRRNAKDRAALIAGVARIVSGRR